MDCRSCGRFVVRQHVAMKSGSQLRAIRLGRIHPQTTRHAPFFHGNFRDGTICPPCSELRPAGFVKAIWRSSSTLPPSCICATDGSFVILMMPLGSYGSMKRVPASTSVTKYCMPWSAPRTESRPTRRRIGSCAGWKNSRSSSECSACRPRIRRLTADRFSGRSRQRLSPPGVPFGKHVSPGAAPRRIAVAKR